MNARYLRESIMIGKLGLLALGTIACEADTVAASDDEVGDTDDTDEPDDSCLGTEWIADAPSLAGNTQVSVSVQLAVLRGVELGDQVRIERAGGEQYALFTIAEVRDLESMEPTMKIGMNAEARMRLGMHAEEPEVCAHLVTNVAPMAPDFTESALREDTRILVMAPHGGDIEADTDAQALLVADLLAAYEPSTWICSGTHEGGGAFRIWHIPSTEISVNSFPALEQLAADDYEWALAFHGFSPTGDCVDGLAEFVEFDDPERLVIVGGLAAPAILEDVAEAIQQALGDSFSVVLPAGGACAGKELDNLVNRMASSLQTVQIESSPAAREGDNHARVAEAVAQALALHL